MKSLISPAHNRHPRLDSYHGRRLFRWTGLGGGFFPRRTRMLLLEIAQWAIIAAWAAILAITLSR